MEEEGWILESKTRMLKKGISCRVLGTCLAAELTGQAWTSINRTGATGEQSEALYTQSDKGSKERARGSGRNIKSKAAKATRDGEARTKEKYSSSRHTQKHRRRHTHTHRHESPRPWPILGNSRRRPPTGAAKDPELAETNPPSATNCKETGGGTKPVAAPVSIPDGPNSGYQLPGTTSRRRAMRPGA